MAFFNNELRKFGLVVGGVFVAIAAFILWRAESFTLAVKICGGFGGALVVLGLAAPRSLAPVQKAWMFLAHILGWINTRLILGVIFYGAFAVARFFLFVFRKDPMLRYPDPAMSTYWVDVPKRKDDAEFYEHPF